MLSNNYRKDLVSIVVVTYNHVNFVDETLASICNQTYKELEIIVCDDGSKDGTAGKIIEWAKKDNRIITILADKNEGLSININKGLDRATGEFFSFMGGDDKMALSKIEKQVGFLKENPDYDVVLHWVDVFDSESGITQYSFNSHIAKSPTDWFLPKVSFGISIKNNDSTFPPTAYFARSTYALKSRFDNRLKYKNEILFAIDNFMCNPEAKWYCLPEVLGFYRIHEGNMHRGKDMKKALMEETYVNYAIASARYPALSGRLRRILQFYLYKNLYYLYLASEKTEMSVIQLEKYRFRMETGFWQYLYAMAFLKAKLIYHRLKRSKI